jgi:tRNA uridine 5-carbamoylmethylation protein Kti12
MKIILFRGRPGSGKTTLTHAFADQVELPILRKDDIYDSVSEYVEDHGQRNVLSHAILYKILESNIHSDVTFVLDFAFQNLKDYSTINVWCKENDVKFKSILVTCSDESVWAERFNKRSENPAPNQLITNFDELKKYYGTMQIEAEEGELVVDTINPVGELVRYSRKFLTI